MEALAKFFIEYGPKGLMAIGLALIVIKFKKNPWTGVVVLLVGFAWFTYQAWEDRHKQIQISHVWERSRDQLKTDIGYDDKTVLYFEVPGFENGQLVGLAYAGMRGPFNFVYQCPDGGKCDAMHKYYSEVKHRPEAWIKENRPTPFIATCEGSWQALSNGDDSVLGFTATYNRFFIESDPQYQEWKSAYPVAYLLVIPLAVIHQPCP
jgi:hypothetical protein